MVAYRQPVLLDVNVFDKDAAVGAAVGACVSPELAGARVGASVGVGGAQFLMKTRQLQHRAKYWEPDAPRLLPDLSEFPPVREPQAEPSAKTRPQVPQMLEYAALCESAVLVASCQPAGTDIGVNWQPYLVSLRGQLSMVAYRQPVLLDVNVFVTGLAVGEMVGAWVSPELVGGGVGACVVTAQAGAQPDRVGAHPLTVIRARAQRAW